MRPSIQLRQPPHEESPSFLTSRPTCLPSKAINEVRPISADRCSTGCHKKQKIVLCALLNKLTFDKPSQRMQNYLGPLDMQDVRKHGTWKLNDRQIGNNNRSTTALKNTRLEHIPKSYKSFADLQVLSRKEMGMHTDNASVDLHCNSKAKVLRMGRSSDQTEVSTKTTE